jgi:outer membrane protein OmpA-like peptidoglycan-associated protein
MANRFVAASLLMIGVGLVAAGCSGSGTPTTDPVAAAPALAPPPEPPPSPPTLAAQHEMALVEMGAKLKDDGLYVTIPGSSLAGKKKDELDSTDKDALDRVAGLTKERAELKVAITGYTDDRGKKAANEKESLSRAEAVREYLVSHKHVDAARTEVKGAGPADPVASNGSDDGRGQNRRVVVRIMTEDGKYQSRAALGVQASTSASSGPTPQ